jgi:hypothetical protein
MMPCPAIPQDNSKKATARARLPRIRGQALALAALRLPRHAIETLSPQGKHG